MADESKKATRAELAEAVRELRDEVARLRAEQAAHCCRGRACGHVHCNWGHCGCWTWHSYSYQVPGCSPSPLWITTSGDTTWGSSTLTVPQTVTFTSIN